MGQRRRAVFFNSLNLDREKDTPFYYGSRDNQLWKDILSPLAQEIGFEDILIGSSGERVTRMKQFLRSQQIWMYDVLETCPRKGSSDQDRHIDFSTARFSKFESILEKCDVEKVVFTGKEPAFWFFCKVLPQNEEQQKVYQQKYKEIDRTRQKIDDIDIRRKFIEPLPLFDLVSGRTIRFYIAPSPSRSYRAIDKTRKREAYKAILFPSLGVQSNTP